MLTVRRALAIIILLAVVAVVAGIWLNRPDTPQQLLDQLPADVDLALQELHYTQNENGRAVWSLDATQAEYQRESGVARLENVALVLYQEREFGQVELTARRGHFDQQANEIEARGDVVLVSERGDRLYTDRLRYDANRKQISTADAFRYLSSGSELTGVGLQIDLVSGRMTVENDVRARFVPEMEP